jgi:chlorophyll synthase
MPGRWGLYIAIAWTAAVAAGGLAAGALGLRRRRRSGLVLAWAYSAPPLRLKRNGWWGNAACGCRTKAWPGSPAPRSWPAAPCRTCARCCWPLLYSVGAHGIMTLNDFKAIEGDRRMGIGSLPVRLGVQGAARAACVLMMACRRRWWWLLLAWGAPWHAGGVAALVALQLGDDAALPGATRARRRCGTAASACRCSWPA